MQNAPKEPATSRFNTHPACGWVGKLAFDLDVYAQMFNGAKAEIAGESPYLNAKSAGLSFALNDDRTVRAVFLYSQGVERFQQYTDPLPAGLSFTSSRAEVRRALGKPVLSGEVGGVGIFAIEFSFDRFEAGDHYLRFEYRSGGEAIRLITIGLVAE
jgi:hypothetical protein